MTFPVIATTVHVRTVAVVAKNPLRKIFLPAVRWSGAQVSGLDRLADMSPKIPFMDAENIHQVFDWLWTSGQLSEKDIASLPELGIAAVINLASPTASNALSGEAELVTRQGIAYIHIPVAWEQPELHRLIQFFGTLKAFEERNVWVHCAKNMRVSVFIYLYRRLCLLESEEASVHPMPEVWVPNETWQTFIHDALNMHSNPALKCPP